MRFATLILFLLFPTPEIMAISCASSLLAFQHQSRRPADYPSHSPRYPGTGHPLSSSLVKRTQPKPPSFFHKDGRDASRLGIKTAGHAPHHGATAQRHLGCKGSRVSEIRGKLPVLRGSSRIVTLIARIRGQLIPRV